MSGFDETPKSDSTESSSPRIYPGIASLDIVGLLGAQTAWSDMENVLGKMSSSDDDKKNKLFQTISQLGISKDEAFIKLWLVRSKFANFLVREVHRETLKVVRQFIPRNKRNNWNEQIRRWRHLSDSALENYRMDMDRWHTFNSVVPRLLNTRFYVMHFTREYVEREQFYFQHVFTVIRAEPFRMLGRDADRQTLSEAVAYYQNGRIPFYNKSLKQHYDRQGFDVFDRFVLDENLVVRRGETIEEAEADHNIETRGEPSDARQEVGEYENNLEIIRYGLMAFYRNNTERHLALTENNFRAFFRYAEQGRAHYDNLVRLYDTFTETN